MSTETGDKAVVKAIVDSGKALLADAAEQEEQLELLEPLTAEDIEAAQERLGMSAGKVAVLREARRGRGRPKGVQNRRTEDFRRYLLRFGQHPAITMMQIQSTPAEELVAQSSLIDVPKRQMSLHDAQSLRVRCAEALLPYLESKQPVAVDATIRGVMVVEEFGSGHRAPGVVIDGEPLGVMPFGDDE
jgi:hypothetical protein